jgi:hypothetical protein
MIHCSYKGEKDKSTSLSEYLPSYVATIITNCTDIISLHIQQINLKVVTLEDLHQQKRGTCKKKSYCLEKTINLGSFQKNMWLSIRAMNKTFKTSNSTLGELYF